MVDPEKGFLVSANNKISSDNLIFNVNRCQNSIPRARRITDVLSKAIEEGTKFTPKHFMEMQKDVFDVYASFIVQPIIEIYHLYALKYMSPERIKQ